MTRTVQASAGGTAAQLRILVVEDDPDALASILEMLQLLGHWATGVRSAEIAKDRFFEGAFDVLMTDVGLPALSGLDLAEILRARHALEIIFVTGRPQPAQPMPGTVWLRKPFDVEQLEAALAQVGNRAGPA
jgi:DNA-binding response OmpR family regulator